MGKREGRLEGELKGSRQPVLDLCEVMGIELSEARREKLGTLGLEEVEALRLHIKASRTWPERGSAKRGRRRRWTWRWVERRRCGSGRSWPGPGGNSRMRRRPPNLA
jgi:hypothetical protein